MTTVQPMHNASEKLSKSREMCPGLSEEVYALADYMAGIATSEEVSPDDMLMLFMLSMEDIQRGRSGYSLVRGEELPEYLYTHSGEILAQAVYFPQIIDAIADKEFAKEFRESCKEALQFDPPKMEEDESIDLDDDYPEYAQVAADWWANTLAKPKLGSKISKIADYANSITDTQIALFKKELAKLIVQELDQYGECILNVDYYPDELLCTAVQNAGIDVTTAANMIFPWGTKMRIISWKVSVMPGYSASWETLWEEPYERPSWLWM